MSNPPNAILRLSKLNKMVKLALVSKHNNRQQDTPNANPKLKKYNRIFIGTDDLQADWQRYINKKGIKKIRKNGVLAVEFVLAFSPCFIKNDDGSYKKNAKNTLQKWLKLNHKWLQEKYGDRIISSIFHQDEMGSPHLHIVLCPSEQKPDGSWKLNARGFFGGKAKLSALQDDYANAMKPLGLVRGTKGSRAKHQSLKSYYTALNKVEKLCEKLAIKKPASRAPKDFGHWTIAMSKIADALSDEHAKKIKSLETELAREKALTQQFIQTQHAELSRELKPKIGNYPQT